jgi:hypothetical protein
MIEFIVLKDGRVLLAENENGSDLYQWPFLVAIAPDGTGQVAIRWGDFIPVGGMKHDEMLEDGVVIDDKEIRFKDDPAPDLLASYEKLVGEMKTAKSGIEVVQTMPASLKR